jgi:hypothetical protein
MSSCVGWKKEVVIMFHVSLPKMISSLASSSQDSQCPSQSYICLLVFSGYIMPSHKFHTDSLWIVGGGVAYEIRLSTHF